MSAKEMFEKIGYVEYKNSSMFAVKSYINKNFIEEPIIYFDDVFGQKQICKEGKKGKLDIYLHELKAINKQVEELGWNNE